MLSVVLILSSIAVLSLSGLPACFLSARSAAGQRITTGLMFAGSLTGYAGLILSFASPRTPSLDLPWFLPWGGFSVAVDPLSAVFLALVFTVPVLGSVYGLGYWKQADHGENGRKLGLFYGLLAGSMALVTVSRDGVLFLLAWEVMAISAWFASTADDHDPEVRKAGWIYFVATHTGTLLLIAMFSLWNSSTGSFALTAAPVVPAAGTLFVLALIGFGFKAGLMPLHVWLPGAHANAPSHVSAVMSGVMLKMGVYGILRMTGLLPVPPVWWGGVILAAGSLTCVAGIAFSLSQSDIKRMLAYSSIENIGIISMGIGLALVGRAAGRPELILLGLGGALLHVWNHGLFKSLLFFGAGAVIHAAHTRNMNRLGGLLKRMPLVGFLFLLGSLAASALPPLNGFVSEWLLYLGLFRTLADAGNQGIALVSTAAVALAMTGALAVACFVKLFGTVFLGLPRSTDSGTAHDPVPSMTVPMVLLAGGCAAVGLFPSLLMPVVVQAAASWSAGMSVGAVSELAAGELAPLSFITRLVFALGALVLMASFLVLRPKRLRSAGSTGTWDCGYARPAARMQYTGSSFGQSIVRLFRFLLQPVKHETKVRGPFPDGARYRADVPDTVLSRLVMPVFSFVARYLPGIRAFQDGRTHMYVLYVLVITIILLVFGVGVQS